MRYCILFFLLFCVFEVFAQTDTTQKYGRVYTHRDSVYLAKLNSSGNLMIAGGVGLTAAGSYLIYQGVKVYNSPVDNSTPLGQADEQRNHRQGTIYLAAAGVGIAGGIILTAFGARNKVDFKRRKKMMQLQSGFLDNGRLGAVLSF